MARNEYLKEPLKVCTQITSSQLYTLNQLQALVYETKLSKTNIQKHFSSSKLVT